MSGHPEPPVRIAIAIVVILVSCCFNVGPYVLQEYNRDSCCEVYRYATETAKYPAKKFVIHMYVRWKNIVEYTLENISIGTFQFLHMDDRIVLHVARYS